jgi:hypothetical protein
MGLEDLFNLSGDYLDAYSLNVAPLFFDSIDVRSPEVLAMMDTGASFWAPEMTTADILAEQFGNGPQRGVDFMLTADRSTPTGEMRASVFEPGERGGLVPIGFRGDDGTVEDLQGRPIASMGFPGFKNDLASSWLRGGGGGGGGSSGGSSGGGGGGRGGWGGGGWGGGSDSVSMPVISAPAAAGSVPALPVAPPATVAIPQTPPPANTFRPLTIDTPRPMPEGNDTGLARLLRAMETTDPYATVRMRAR